ncbi:hypothetical protein [Chitinophaga sp. OAE865]|uniref:TerC family protein n=1 Tax=Chitinophaga sp. OAE865 TaxID=2817898 RepID=UPI0033910450
MEHLLTVDSLISLLTLTTLEIVLGIDNIVFISILAGKLPENKQKKSPPSWARAGDVCTYFIAAVYQLDHVADKTAF